MYHDAAAAAAAISDCLPLLFSVVMLIFSSDLFGLLVWLLELFYQIEPFRIDLLAGGQL